MFKKTLTLAVGATGYVLGARAGRQRYEQIKQQADRLWSNPQVQKAAADAQDIVAEKAPVVKDKVAEKVSKATSSSGSSDA
jgi:hypothetical protein